MGCGWLFGPGTYHCGPGAAAPASLCPHAAQAPAAPAGEVARGLPQRLQNAFMAGLPVRLGRDALAMERSTAHTSRAESRGVMMAVLARARKVSIHSGSTSNAVWQPVGLTRHLGASTAMP